MNQLNNISEIVADAVNTENFGDALKNALHEIPDNALEKSFIYYVMASQPGCLPDSQCAFPMDADHDDIREEILSLIDDEETDWEAVRKDVEALNLMGDSMTLPDGRIIEVFGRSCAKILKDNGVSL